MHQDSHMMIMVLGLLRVLPWVAIVAAVSREVDPLSQRLMSTRLMYTHS